MGEAWGGGGGGGGGGLKMLSKNAFEGVHLIVKLPAISLQACKFTKNELFFPKNLAISIINTLDKNGLKYRKEKLNKEKKKKQGLVSKLKKKKPKRNEW